MVLFTTVEAVNDELGIPNIEGVEGEPYISPGGLFSPDRVNSMIAKFSDMINTEHRTNVQKTEYVEYIFGCGLVTIMVSHYPIISITTIEEQLSDGSWSEKTQGMNPNSDDFYLLKADAGIIKFHSPVSEYFKVTYYAGYYDDEDENADVPGIFNEACTLMTKIAIAGSKTFLEENKDQVPKWKELLRQWKGELKTLMDNHIVRNGEGAWIIGHYEKALTSWEWLV